MLAQWQSPLYQEISAIVLATLVVFAAFLFFAQKKSKFFLVGWISAKSWLVAGPILLLVCGFSQPWPLVFLTLACIYSSKIFLQITGMYHRSNFVWLCYSGLIFQAFAVYQQNDLLYNLMPMIVFAAICLVPIFRNSYKRMIQYMALTLMAFSFMGWGLMHFGKILLWDQGIYIIIYIIILAEFCDSMNLATSRFGKKKFLTTINPRRTLEGFAVAFIVTLLLAWGLRHLLPDRSEIVWISSAIIILVAGTIGDFTLSVIRRDLGIKDVGPFILGRSDLLNRIDRFIFVGPIYYYTMKFLMKF